MVPSQHSTSFAFSVFAAATKVLLQNSDTPKRFRDKLARFAAELRDTLAEDMAHMVDGAEAEIVIMAYADSLPASQTRGDNPQTLHQKLDELQAILGDSEK